MIPDEGVGPQAIDDIIDLIDTPAELNTYWGNKLMEYLVPHILIKAELNLALDILAPGSPYFTTYRVKTRESSSDPLQFTGYPDFIIRTQQRRRQRRFPSAVGEFQSLRGGNKALGSIAQAGIYSLGLCVESNLSRMVAIVLTKKKGAHLLALEYACNDWSMKYIDSMEATSLKSPEGIQQFARVLVASLQWQMIDGQH